MKKLVIVSALFIQMGYLYGQNEETEAEIRSLEQIEVQAVLKKDSVTLLKIWDKNFVVNAPDNIIYFAGNTTLDRPVLKSPRTSFTREIEHVIIKGDFAFSMGSESVAPTQQGELIKRRFTNIWEKQESGWKLVARHANVICKPN